MKSRMIQKFQWIAAKLSIVSMVMLPVAEGQAAETYQNQISKQQLQQVFLTMGLNKTQTFGEFYAKNKSYLPIRIQKELNQFVKNNAKTQMPVMEITSSQNSKGEEILGIRATAGNELFNIQVVGDSNQYYKVNHIPLTEVDLINFKDTFLKMYLLDAKYRKPSASTTSISNNQKAVVAGFPEMTKEVWKKLTPEQRAGYIIQLRSMWSEAREVLYQKNKKNVKTSNLNYESVFDFLIPKSFAATAGADSSAFQEEKACLIAGYVTQYSTKVCDVKKIKGSYMDSDLYAKASSACGSGKIACNPLVFGTPNGQPTCITPSRTDINFQRATHYEGPCDSNSRLGSKVQFLKDDKLTTGRYDTDNLKMSDEEVKAQLKKDQGENFKNTKEFLAGILKFKNPELVDAFINGKMDDKTFEQIKKIHDDFNEEIRQSKEACVTASNQNQKHEKNFWQACDQLHRRQLFIKEYFDKNPGCKSGGSVDPVSLKCKCPNSENEVIPGGECKKEDAKPPVSGGLQCPKGMSREGNGPEDYKCFCQGGAGNFSLEEANSSGFNVKEKCALLGGPQKPEDPTSGKCDPACTGGSKCIFVTKSEETKAEVWECRGGAAGVKPTPPKSKEESWFSSFFKKALPFVIIGVGLVVGYYVIKKLFIPKKPVLKPAADKCPNGTTPPCVQQCQFPQVQVGTSCTCPGCAPGQTRTNMATCECSYPESGGGTTLITCPDGISQRTDLSLCPGSNTKITCWNGAQVDYAINCPEAPTATSGVSQ